YFDVQADLIASSVNDLQTVPMSPYSQGKRIEIPANLKGIGNFSLKGKFSGFYNDFVAYGNLNSGLGYVSSDINLKFNPKLKKEFYSGHLSATNLNLGKITSNYD